MRRTIPLALALSTLLLTACAVEQEADLEKLGEAPAIGSGLELAKSEEPSTTEDGTAYAFIYKKGDDFLAVQFEGSKDATGSDWDIESALPVVADYMGAEPADATPTELSPDPASIGAWTGTDESVSMFAQAWERNQCVALVITTLSPSDATAAIEKIDEHLIEACGE